MENQLEFRGDVLTKIKNEPEQLEKDELIKKREKLMKDISESMKKKSKSDENLEQDDYKNKDIHFLKSNLNFMIKQVVESKQNYFGSSSDKIALINECVGIVTDIHGDLFSLLSSLYCMGAITLQENDFIFYNDKGIYYTQDEYEKSDDCLKYILILRDIIELSEIFDEYNRHIEKISESENQDEEEFLRFGCNWTDRNKNEYTIRVECRTIRLMSMYKCCVIKKDDENGVFIEDLIKDLKREIKAMGRICIFPTPHLNPKFKGLFVNLGDYIDRGNESIECLCISELLAMAGLNIINCIGNHEAMSIGYEELNKIVRRGIKNRCFTTGKLIDTGKIDKEGKTIYESFSHTILCKGHLYKLFSILKSLVIEKGKVAGVDFSDEWELEKTQLNNELIEKIESIDFNDEVFNMHMSPDEIYNFLIEFGFGDKDFFELKIAVGNTIFNELYNKSYFKKNGFDFIAEIDESFKLDFIFGERYWPKSQDEIFLNINQNIGHDAENFIIMSEKFNVIRHDVFRSIGYRKGETRICALIKNIRTDEVFLFSNIWSEENKKFVGNEYEVGILKDKIDSGCIIRFDEFERSIAQNKGSFYAKKKDENEIKKFISKKRMKKFFGIDTELLGQICINKSECENKAKLKKVNDDCPTK